MKWDESKLAILRDSFEYVDLDELAKELGCTVKAVRRKAEKLHLKRATNNQILNYDVKYKYCSFCKKEHPLLDELGNNNFHRDKYASYGFKYYCKKYNEQLNLLKETPPPTTPPLNQKRGNPRVEGENLRDKIKHRPKNPIVIRNGVEGKICNGCKVWKPLDDYGRDLKGIGEKRARCKLCMKK